MFTEQKKKKKKKAEAISKKIPSKQLSNESGRCITILGKEMKQKMAVIMLNEI